jgi:hypothetical protein
MSGSNKKTKNPAQEIADAIKTYMKKRFEFAFVVPQTNKDTIEYYFTDIGDMENTDKNFANVENSLEDGEHDYCRVILKKRSADILVTFEENLSDNVFRATSLAVVPMKFLIKRKHIAGAVTAPVQRPKGWEGDGDDWGDGGGGTGRESFREQVIDQGESWRNKYEKAILENLFNMTKTSTKETKKGNKITKTFVVRSTSKGPSPVKSSMGTPSPARSPTTSPSIVSSLSRSLSKLRSPSKSSTPVKSPSKSLTPVKSPSKSLTPVKSLSPAIKNSGMSPSTSYDAKNIISENRSSGGGAISGGAKKKFDTFAQFKKYIFELENKMVKAKYSSMHKKIKITEYPKCDIELYATPKVDKLKDTGKIIRTYFHINFYVYPKHDVEMILPAKMSNWDMLFKKPGGVAETRTFERVMRELEEALKKCR